ncbi:uncharacterized protein TNCV_1193581 [Trichonephila clavipes]|nr:uncharacterized protein TNCV_1193581 [Trichonephila clavipes]
MPRRRIRAHYEQLSEFERGRIIGLKEEGWANRRIARHMGRSDAAIRRCWNHADWRRIVFSNEFHFHLCLNDHRRHVWRRQVSETIRVLYHSVSRCVAACLQARCGSTPY